MFSAYERMFKGLCGKIFFVRTNDIAEEFVNKAKVIGKNILIHVAAGIPIVTQ